MYALVHLLRSMRRTCATLAYSLPPARTKANGSPRRPFLPTTTTTLSQKSRARVCDKDIDNKSRPRGCGETEYAPHAGWRARAKGSARRIRTSRQMICGLAPSYALLLLLMIGVGVIGYTAASIQRQPMLEKRPYNTRNAHTLSSRSSCIGRSSRRPHTFERKVNELQITLCAGCNITHNIYHRKSSRERQRDNNVCDVRSV